VPNNATAVLVGDVDAEAMFDLIAGKYGDIPAGEQPPEVRHAEPSQYGERRLTVNREGTTAYVMLTYRAPAIGDADFFPLVVLDSILSGPSSFNAFGGGGTSNKTSRLYRALVETELAANVGGGVNPTIDPYLYTVSATVRTGHTCEEVEAAIDAELRRAAGESVTQEEFDKARKQAKALFAFSSESVTNQGMWLGMAETLAGDYAWFEDYLDQLMAVTLDDVSRVARNILDPDQRTVGWYVPTGNSEA
jgi:zinc protease